MEKHIIEEAKRCLQCKKPRCMQGCPNKTPINNMVKLLLEGNIHEAGKMLFENNPLSAICSRICPHEKFCEGHCVLNRKEAYINISAIENYISTQYLDHCKKHMQPELQKEKIAVLGAGPSGLTVAFILALNGYDITIFDSEDNIGGVLQYGIPDFRLPKELLEKLKTKLYQLGVKIRPNMLIGPVVTLDDLLRDAYSAVFIGTGVWNPKPLRIKGETLGHVHYAINYLKKPSAFNLGNHVVVIGAGNVAMDAARTALRNGAENVTVLYRRGKEDISATRYEYDCAVEEGVFFSFYNSPVEIVENGILYAETRKTFDQNGNITVEVDTGSTSLLHADSIIIAVSQAPRKNLRGIELGKNGLVVVDEEGRTNREGIFASGDVVTGAKTVAEATYFSKKVARTIMNYLQKKAIEP